MGADAVPTPCSRPVEGAATRPVEQFTAPYPSRCCRNAARAEAADQRWLACEPVPVSVSGVVLSQSRVRHCADQMHCRHVDTGTGTHEGRQDHMGSLLLLLFVGSQLVGHLQGDEIARNAW